MQIVKLLFLFLFIYTSVNAQKNIQDLKKSVQLDIGFGKHGTGDINGLNINSEYKRFFSKNLSISFGLGATLHGGAFPILYSDGNGNLIDASYRYTTGGLQLTSKVGISFIKSTINDFGLQVGPILRYQSSSYFDEINVLYPAATGLPTPVIAIINKSPQKTFSLGGIGQLYYNYTIKNNVFIGLSAAIQIDTNGDLINQLAVSCGLRL
ncbi:MAG: hypothetical protein JNK08_05595 [Sediminibacterium sp.]|jgi:hypothetical protein|nr:hypothetical protein [Sediminibacterium sp.]